MIYKKRGSCESTFVRCLSAYLHSVYIRLQQRSQRIINHAMSLQLAMTFETGSDNSHIKMAATVFRSCVADVKMTLIFDQ